MPMSRMTLLSVSVTGVTCDTSALRPMAAATADRASTSGTPAAIRAPKVSSRITSVMGRLSFSAREKSDETWSPIATSSEASPTSAIRRSGWPRATAAVAARTAGTLSSAAVTASSPVASPTESTTGRIAALPSWAKVSSPTVATCGSAVSRVRSWSAAPRAAAGSRRPAPAGLIRTRSVGVAGKPACSTTRSAVPDSPVPCSAEVRRRVPAAPPATNTTATKTNQPITAFSRCRVLQRASRSTNPPDGTVSGAGEEGRCRGAMAVMTSLSEVVRSVVTYRRRGGPRRLWGQWPTRSGDNPPPRTAANRIVPGLASP